MKAVVFTAGGAHLNTMMGMLEELERSKRLEGVHAYAGISAGAILASFCATRPVATAIKQLRSILLKHCCDAIKPHYKYLNLPLSALFQNSILDDSGLTTILKAELEGKEVQGDLYIGLTNETRMCYEIHHFGPRAKKNTLTLGEAVHASMSIPVIFEGEDTNDGQHLSDGGVFHQVPVLAIQQMLKHALQEKSVLDLTILASSPWKYAPDMPKSSYPLLARRTWHYMDCLQTNNMTTDREILREAFEIYKDKVKVDFKMFMLPSVLAQKLHKTFTFTKLSHISENEIEKLLNLGRNIVRANSATYSIDQDEPSPFLDNMHLKY
mgnify:CR=1 FL=1